MAIRDHQSGTSLGRGGFVLDRTRALEKLREFQLPSPYYYVLEFVKAANILGATTITFSLSVATVEVSFDGEEFTPEELEDLYSAAFSYQRDRRQDALRHLALGVIVAQGLGLRDLTIQIGGESPHGVKLRDDDISPLPPVSETPTPGTRIVLRRRAQPSHIPRFIDRLRGQLSEARMLRDKCADCRTPIFVDGERISHGFNRIEEGHFPVYYRHEGESGVVALTADNGHFHTSLLQHGVLIGEDRWATSFVDFGCQAIVDSSLLTANLSQSAFVEDDAWYALRERLGDVACLAQADYLESLSDDDVRRQRKGLRIRLFSVIGSLRHDTPRHVVTRLVDVFEQLKIFPGADVTSTISISDARHGDELHFSTHMAPQGMDIEDGPVLYVDTGDLRIPDSPHSHDIQKVLAPFAEKLIDRRPDFERRKNYRLFRQRIWNRDNLSLSQLKRFELGHWQITVGVGWRVGPGATAQDSTTTVYYIKDGCLLGESSLPRKFDLLSHPIFIEISSDQMAATDAFDGPRPTGALRVAQKAALQLLARENFFEKDLDGLYRVLAHEHGEFGDFLLSQFRNLFSWPEMPRFSGPLEDFLARAKTHHPPTPENGRKTSIPQQNVKVSNLEALLHNIERNRSATADLLESHHSPDQWQKQEKPRGDQRIPQLVDLLKEHSSPDFQQLLDDHADLVQSIDKNHPAIASYLAKPDELPNQVFAAMAVFTAINHTRHDSSVESWRQARREKLRVLENLSNILLGHGN